MRMELIDRPAKLYRVGRANSGQGLWYDENGESTGIIHTVEGAAAAALPMGPNPIFRTDGRRWISVTDSLDGLRQWFSRSDILQLMARGYRIEEIVVLRYRRVHLQGFSHEVYCDEEMVVMTYLPPVELYPDIFERRAA